MSEIVVVGAGVIGLSAAQALCEKGYKVKVVAAHFPTDPLNSRYTSPWAGAHYRPFPSKSPKEFEESQLTRKTLEYFEKLAVEEPQSSVKFIDGIDYLEEKGLYNVKAKGYYEGIQDMKEIPKNQLPKGVEFGAKYRTWVLNSPLYIQYLQRKLIFKYGVEFIRTELTSLKQVSQSFPNIIIVNASGLGLQYNGGYDPKSYVIRGQTLLVRAPEGHPYEKQTITHQSKDGLWTFVIPRPLDGGLIVGGTKEIFINGELDIKNINVGFRPAREGGIRIEIEKVGKQYIVHDYGFGGMGYELSRGSAEEVLKLVESIPTVAKL
ncbi:unnamed protein product [Wickerhamomyces anomalus]